MEWIADYGVFLLKSVTVLVAFIVFIGFVASLSQRQKSDQRDGHVKIQSLNDDHEDNLDEFLASVLEPEAYKQHKKDEKKAKKAQAKKAGKKDSPEEGARPRVFVMDFDGDIKASAVEGLRREISTLVANKLEGDSVILRLESPGGMVHSYGLAASQLDRIKKAGIKLRVSVDAVAASGGYMMACVADEIVAAPFSVIGSIGVVAQVPNVHRLLKKNDVDVEVLTAGKYKRTLTVLGENTEEGRQKFIDDLESTHALFKTFVQEHRPRLDIEAIATGEIWYGKEAIDKGLVDRIATSDDLILEALKTSQVFRVSYEHKKTLAERLGFAAEQGVVKAFEQLLAQQTKRWF